MNTNINVFNKNTEWTWQGTYTSPTTKHAFSYNEMNIKDLFIQYVNIECYYNKYVYAWKDF